MHALASMLAAPPAPPPPPPEPAGPSGPSLLAWLLPVLAGLTLTACAFWKHKGLPGGH